MSRAKRITISVSEHGLVPLPPEMNTPAIRERLLAAAQAAGMPDALVLRRRRLHAGNCVGVVDIGVVAVEILPKTRQGSSDEEARTFLTNLLRLSGRDKRGFAAHSASVRETSDGLVEVILGWAARSIAEEMNNTFPRRYRERTQTSPAIRGRVSMSDVARALPGRRLEFVVTHAPLTADNPIGRSLLWLLHRIAELTRRGDTRAIALAAAEDLNGVAAVDLDEVTLDAAELRPMEAHWEPYLRLARSLLRQRRLDPTRAGEAQAVAVLFTLHDLFEGILRGVIARHGPASGLRLKRIPSHLLLSHSGPRVRIRPDFSFGLDGTPGIAIADAKWKDVWRYGGKLDAEPEPSDAYQVVAYMTAGRAHCGFLIAPLPEWADSTPLCEFPHTITGSDNSLTVIGVHLPTLVSPAGGDKLAEAFCKMIAARMRHSVSSPTPTAYSAAT